MWRVVKPLPIECGPMYCRLPGQRMDRATGNLRAVHLLLGHTKIESTVRILGVDVEDALNPAEHP
jgi:hypothetical protein